ncbi:glycosyltransferase [Thioalkalivibrio sp. ALR17-21]|uniref:glycosyltransferase n=1 Tax=Thioalkalivibrio sp. ALR17-21 TaxID=1269813 RepID=UPI0009DB76F5|nr:glycosyltransferase [Thioalkalivibrio sp. ALR17-21]
MPFDELGDLQAKAADADLDVLVGFYTRENVMRYAALADAIGIPLVVQECTNPDRARFNNWRLAKVSRSRASWEREIVTAAATRLRLVMPGYADSFAAFQQPQIHAMPNSCPKVDVRACPDQSLDGRWRILLVNGFKDNKNLVDAVAAFARLALQHPDWVLRVVGKAPSWEAPHAKQVAEILDENALWERFEIAEATDDIAAEYCGTHIHLIASLSEGCPTVVLEAMAAGLPSVGFEDCPGTNELIRHEENGLLARADDRVAGLAGALARLMADPEWRATLGRQAGQDAADFDPCHTYDQWEQLLTEAAGYRDNPDRLFREQYGLDPERALHARRMRHKILET